MKGIYFLVIELNSKEKIKTGALGVIDFQPGNYIYVGSAQNGIEQRVGRHLSGDKKRHWHIDYILEEGEIIEAYAVKTERKEDECWAARYVNYITTPIEGFGCSDCSCDSHLFRHDGTLKELKRSLEQYTGIQKLGLKTLKGQ